MTPRQTRYNKPDITPEQHQELLLGIEQFHISRREVARVLNCSVQTVGNKINHKRNGDKYCHHFYIDEYWTLRAYIRTRRRLVQLQHAKKGGSTK